MSRLQRVFHSKRRYIARGLQMVYIIINLRCSPVTLDYRGLPNSSPSGFLIVSGVGKPVDTIPYRVVQTERILHSRLYSEVPRKRNGYSWFTSSPMVSRNH